MDISFLDLIHDGLKSSLQDREKEEAEVGGENPSWHDWVKWVSCLYRTFGTFRTLSVLNPGFHIFVGSQDRSSNH